MIGKFWAYLTLIAGEGQRAYAGRRRAPLDKPVAAHEWLTPEQGQKTERGTNNANRPH